MRAPVATKEEGGPLRGRVARYGAIAGAMGLVGASGADAVPIHNSYNVGVTSGAPVFLDVDNDSVSDLRVEASFFGYEAIAAYAFVIAPARAGVEVAHTAGTLLPTPPWYYLPGAAGNYFAAAFTPSQSVGGGGTSFTTANAVLVGEYYRSWMQSWSGTGNFQVQPAPQFAGFRFTGGGVGFVQLLHADPTTLVVQASVFDPVASSVHVQAPVPEPSSLALLAAGAAGVAALRRRRTANAA